MTDKQMERRVLRAYWSALDEVREAGCTEALQLMLLVTGLNEEGEQICSFRGYFVGSERMLDALERLSNAIREGNVEPAPEIDQEPH